MTAYASEAAACKAHSLLYGRKHALAPHVGGDKGDFAEPRWGRWDRLRRRLDCHRGIGDTGHWSSLFGNVVFFPHKEAHFSACPLPFRTSLRNPWVRPSER